MIWKNLKKNCQSKQKFYSVLTGKKLKDKEHEHALNVWNKFENKTMEDYHNLYLKCDILLLADVLDVALKSYALCPSLRVTGLSATGLSWDGTPKLAKIKLELFLDPDMYTFFEKETGSKISEMFNRYYKVNNKYLKSYDTKQDQNMLYTYTTLIYIVMQCLNLFQQVDSNGQILKSLS